MSNYAYAWRCGPNWCWWYLRRGRVLPMLRVAYWTFARGHIGEACQDCGRPYILWHAPDDLWQRAMGRMSGSGNRSGLLCPACFNRWLIASGLLKGVIFIPEPFLDWYAGPQITATSPQRQQESK